MSKQILNVKPASQSRCPSLRHLLIAFLALAPGGVRAAASSMPQEFAPGIISTGHEFTITFTPDGREACFSRYAPNKPLHIFCSRLVDSKWQQPQPISFSNDRWSDLDPFITADGKRMFFVSTQPHETDTTSPAKKNMDIWVVERVGETWGTPHVLDNVNSEAKEGSPAISADGTLYFFSDRSRSPNSNSLYTSKLANGRYAAPLPLPSPINSTSSDTSPFITPDGNLLLFYSDRIGGLGKGDLYAAERNHGSWRAPVNLGSVVNTAGSEYNPELSPDRRQLFFGRDGRIFIIPVKAVPPLRKLSPRRHSGYFTRNP